jgi:hypothetical protein
MAHVATSGMPDMRDPSLGSRWAGLVHTTSPWRIVSSVTVALHALLGRLVDHRRDVDAEALRLVDEQRLDRAVQALEQAVGDPLVHPQDGTARL